MTKLSEPGVLCEVDDGDACGVAQEQVEEAPTAFLRSLTCRFSGLLAVASWGLASSVQVFGAASHLCPEHLRAREHKQVRSHLQRGVLHGSRRRAVTDSARGRLSLDLRRAQPRKETRWPNVNTLTNSLPHVVSRVKVARGKLAARSWAIHIPSNSMG